MNVLKRNPPTYYERNLRNMVAVTRASGADILFVTWANSLAHDDFIRAEHYQVAIREINAATTRIAEETGVFVYELDKEMPRQAQYWWDNRHVNEEGARIKAKLTAKGIANYVCPRATRLADG